MNIRDVIAERNTTHGGIQEVGRISQGIKKVFKTSKNWNLLSDPQKESLEMVAHKLARLLSGDLSHSDHIKDLRGYITLFEGQKND